MTAAVDTLAALQARGYQVLREGPSLRLRGPQHLDSNVQAAVVAHKQEILRLLDARDDATRRDPRPDLKDDAAYWATLLALSWARDGHDRYGVHGALLGMRCLGVSLLRGKSTLALRPRTELPGTPPAWVTPEQYQLERRRWLDPHREAVISLLEAAAR